MGTSSSVAGTQASGKTFVGNDGIAYDVADIFSMTRNSDKSSVVMDLEGQRVTVEITPTEAINIIELFS